MILSWNESTDAGSGLLIEAASGRNFHNTKFRCDLLTSPKMDSYQGLRDDDGLLVSAVDNMFRYASDRFNQIEGSLEEGYNRYKVKN